MILVSKIPGKNFKGRAAKIGKNFVLRIGTKIKSIHFQFQSSFFCLVKAQNLKSKKKKKPVLKAVQKKNAGSESIIFIYRGRRIIQGIFGGEIRETKQRNSIGETKFTQLHLKNEMLCL